MTLPTLWLCLIIFRLETPLLASKSHRMATQPEAYQVEAPDGRVQVDVKGLDVVIYQKADAEKA